MRLLVALVLSLLPVQAFALVTTYTDSAQWEQAVGYSYVLEDFEGVSPYGGGVWFPFQIDRPNFTITAPGDMFIINDAPGYEWGTGSIFYSQNPYTVTINFSRPATAFAGDFMTMFPYGQLLRIGAGGQTFTLPTDTWNPTFFGMTFDNPISSVTVFAPNSRVAFDNIAFGDIPSVPSPAVPEPATALLLLLGLPLLKRTRKARGVDASV